MIIRINCGKPIWTGIVIALSLLLKLHFYFAIIIMSTQNGLSYLHELFSFLVLPPENAAQPIDRFWIFLFSCRVMLPLFRSGSKCARASPLIFPCVSSLTMAPRKRSPTFISSYRVELLELDSGMGNEQSSPEGKMGLGTLPRLESKPFLLRMIFMARQQASHFWYDELFSAASCSISVTTWSNSSTRGAGPTSRKASTTER